LQDGELREGDRTRGCIAVTDSRMEEIWSLVLEREIVIKP